MVELGIPSGIVAAEASLFVGGEAQPQLAAALSSLVVLETTEGLYRCEASFGNWDDRGSGVDYRYFDRKLLDFGKDIVIKLGAGDGEAEVFQGKISAIEGQFRKGEPAQVGILAEDVAQNLRQTRRTRTFEEISDADVFEQIARDHSLTPAIDLNTPTYPVIAQLNQSDLAFMRERAWRHDAEVWVEGNTLHVQSRVNRQQGGDRLMLEINRGLLEFNAIADTANQYSEVVVSGWDVQAKDRSEYRATDSVLGNELNGGISAARIVREAFGERVDRLARQMPLTSEETQAIAEASFRTQARRFVVGTGKARGDARIRVGRAIDLQGLGTLFSGTYYLSETYHTFHRQPGGGYSTEFVVERPAIGRA